MSSEQQKDQASAEESQFQSLVRVRAQVMTRDDSLNCWVPLGGGGLSNVSVRKRNTEKNEYMIYGKRISDQMVVLLCTIKKDFEYNKVMPTFHHWKTGDLRFGLTFQTAADARAFDKGVRMAIEELLDGGIEFSPLRKYKDIGDDDVFMTLDLPLEKDSISSSGSSGTGSASILSHQYPPHSHHLHRMYFSSSRKDNNSSITGVPLKEIQSISSTTKEMLHEKDMMKENFMKDEEPYSSYVQFARDRYPQQVSEIIKEHEYSYPIVQPDISNKYNNPIMSNSNFSNVANQQKKSIQLDPLSLQPPPLPLLPTKSKSGSLKKKRVCGKKRRCIDCQMVYSEDSNPKGSCGSGPDSIRNAIDTLTCMGCANGAIYHCFSGVEGEMPDHPCQLRDHSSSTSCTRRWIALGLLSLILPCLCLFPIFACCHRGGKWCGVCGARHHPS